MAAILTSTQIIFGDGTTLTSKYGIVPQSSSSVFLQSSAPVGWSKSTAHNDKALRVVSGTGGGFGPASGGSAFTSVFPNSLRTVSVANIPVSGTVQNTTLEISQLAGHVHQSAGYIGLSPGGGDVGAGAGWTRVATEFPASGGGGAHKHPWSGTTSFSINLDFRVQYVDIIVCAFS